ncbi:GGDEF domain-containing protein [Pelomonas sp. KK5]|uniref:GGDEF domain-containing protein n=1 Tax=Pelomonas sp. KK5 TaxID=1855730 RepID=UPI00097CBAC6|nr:GGDEF domain-containing protein [Pelomonas sp. KK5]
MYLNHRLEDPPAETRTRQLPNLRRATDFQPLLQLPSLEAFGTQIHRKLVNSRSAGRRPAVMLLAVDMPESGVARGELLAAVGARMRSRVRATDLVAQIGECFAVYLDGDVAAHAASIRERLKLALQEEFGFGELSLRIRPRFGLVVHPGTPVSGVDLVNVAAQAFED